MPNKTSLASKTNHQLILPIIQNYDLLHHKNIKSRFISELNNHAAHVDIKLERAIWDIVLILCESFLRKEKNTISVLCYQSKLSETTTRRVLKKLESIGLIKRIQDRIDQRRCFIELTVTYQEILNTFVDECVDEFKDLIIVSDKGERLKAQEAQRQAEAYLQHVVDSVPALISYVDSNQHYVFNNSSYSSWFDCDINELKGKHIRDVLGLDAYKKVAPHIKKVLSGEQVRFETEVPYNNTNNTLYIQATYTPDISETGKIKGFVAHISDITRQKQIEQILDENRRQLEMVISATAVGIWDWQIQTGEVVFNERWANIVGYTLQELKPTNIDTWLSLAHPDDLKHSEQLLKQHWYGETKYYVCEARMKHKLGHWIWVYDTGQVVEWQDDGQPKRMIGSHLDITEHKNYETVLKKQEDILLEAQKVAHIGHWEWDISTNALQWSDEVFRIFGLTPQAITVTYEAFLDMVHPDDREGVSSAVNEAVYHNHNYDIEHRLILSDGSEKFVHERGIVKFDEQRKPTRMLGTVHDITGRKKLEKKLKCLSEKDPLTGLYNRRRLIVDYTHELKRAVRFKRKMALFYMDIDKFKAINDELGHEVGDKLLVHISEILKIKLRENEYIYRVGGDEFCILVPEFSDKKQLENIALRLVNGIVNIEVFGGMEIDIGCSIGIAIYPDNGETLKKLTSAADQAMYFVKTSHKNNFGFAN